MIVFSAWLGAEGVLIGQAVGGVAFGLLSYVLIRRVMDVAKTVAPDEPFASQTRLFTLFHHRR